MMDDAIAKQLELLLLGCGFNFYRIENQLRADDLLIRQKAGAALGRAVAQLEKLASEFQTACIPPPTRQSPFPPELLMARLRVLRSVRQRVFDQESLLRGLPAPAQDKIWRRLRDEEGLLQSLLQSDVAMLQLAAEVERQAELLSADGWKSADAGGSLVVSLDHWDAAVRARQEMLEIRGYR
jgi:hypothetical protein